ncbi:hypothetical protein ACF0H5_017406 [Mactra antiquata]
MKKKLFAEAKSMEKVSGKVPVQNGDKPQMPSRNVRIELIEINAKEKDITKVQDG